MDAAASLHTPAGAPRLLAHCAAVGRVVDVEPGSAWARLERELGRDLARLLRVALAGPRSHSAAL